jgi:hypothetical protein
MAEVTETTPPAGSLEEGAVALGKLLAGTPETEELPKTQPEQSRQTADGAEQAPPTPEKDGSEGAESNADEQQESAAEQSEAVPVVTVKVDGKEIEIPLDEALKGYSRTQDYTRKTQQLAEERKQFESAREAELQALRAERTQYADVLPELKKVLASLTTEPDWKQRATEVSPQQFAEEVSQWRATQERIKALDAETQRLSAQQQKEQAEAFQATLQAEQKALTDALPELAEPEKARERWTAWKDYATKDLGFTDEQFNGVTDHRVLLLVHKAMQFDRQQAKAPQIKNKIEQKLKATGPGTNQAPARPSKVAEATQRLRQSGRVEDAAAALDALWNPPRSPQ